MIREKYQHTMRPLQNSLSAAIARFRLRLRPSSSPYFSQVRLPRPSSARSKPRNFATKWSFVMVSQLKLFKRGVRSAELFQPQTLPCAQPAPQCLLAHRAFRRHQHMKSFFSRVNQNPRLLYFSGKSSEHCSDGLMLSASNFHHFLNFKARQTFFRRLPIRRADADADDPRPVHPRAPH